MRGSTRTLISSVLVRRVAVNIRPQCPTMFPKSSENLLYIRVDICSPLSHNGEQMSTERLNADVRTRVSPTVKAEFERIAEDRHLDVADIVREALREYLARHPHPQNEKAEVGA